MADFGPCALLVLALGCGSEPRDPVEPGGPVSFELGDEAPLEGPLAVGTDVFILVRGLAPNFDHTVVSLAPDVAAAQAAPHALTEPPHDCLLGPPCGPNPEFKLTTLAQGAAEIRLLGEDGVRARLFVDVHPVAGVNLRIWRQLGGDDQERVMPELGSNPPRFSLVTGDLAYVGWNVVDQDGVDLIGVRGVSFASSNEQVLHVNAYQGIPVDIEAKAPGAAELVVTTSGPTVSFEFEVR